jgi:predicted polyphosphate/ATP-dependent NAD kinase
MTNVGIIANPASGKDIRRIVAYGSVFDNQEKVQIVRRVLLGLEAMGVDRVTYMPDYHGIVDRALDGLNVNLKMDRLEFYLNMDQRDSTEAAKLMVRGDAGCIVTLGGDGTNRVVAKGTGTVPIMPISTGTNNVFPFMIEATVAGMAAGLTATGKIAVREGAVQHARLEVVIDDQIVDSALVDAVVCDDYFVGSRAIWKTETIKQVFLNRAEPDNIGFSSIGGLIRTIAPQDPTGLRLDLGPGGTTVTAPLAPGVITQVSIKAQFEMPCGEMHAIQHRPCVIALDGEREVEVRKDQQVFVRVSANGPVVVDVSKTMAAAQKHATLLNPETFK